MLKNIKKKELMAAINPRLGTRDDFQISDMFRLKHGVAIGVGLLGHTLTYVFRRDAYRQYYLNSPPSLALLEVASLTGMALQSECLIAAFVVTLVYYALMPCSDSEQRHHR
jgi:hypothetical protein